MPIRFVPNDPLALATLPVREQAPRPAPGEAQAGFSFADGKAEDLYALDSGEFRFWQCREAALATLEAWGALAPPPAMWQNGQRLLPLRDDGGIGLNAFYDRSAQYSYFKGCSTGGRMALMEAQRYPNDYDGIIAGSLASRHIHMWTAGIERSISLSRNPDRAITAEQAALVNNLVTNKCDTLKEGFLNNPRACKVDFSALKCQAGASGNSCLTDAQMKTVETFYGGVKNSKGELIFSGQALGNPINAQQPTNQAPGGVYDLVRIAYNDPNVNWQTFDLDRDMKFLDEKIGYVDAVNPDLSKYKASGGKLLITHGWSDTGITPETSIWYYESVLNKMGNNQSDWLRLFMAPGMGHCGGGPGVNTFDSIGTLEKWVEKGIAPDTMLGTGANGLSRPLCPYPQYAEYKGSGNVKDASNWSCRAPSTTR